MSFLLRSLLKEIKEFATHVKKIGLIGGYRKLRLLFLGALIPTLAILWPAIHFYSKIVLCLNCALNFAILIFFLKSQDVEDCSLRTIRLITICTYFITNLYF